MYFLINFPDLAKLLEARISVIADHEFRDRDPGAHLEALKSVSEAIGSWHKAHRSEIDGNLDYFLTGASYQKALLYLETGTRRPCGEVRECGYLYFVAYLAEKSQICLRIGEKGVVLVDRLQTS
ncbi:MAG: hypothetical protein ACJA16_002901 [Akkermansiaceae bacterium]